MKEVMRSYRYYFFNLVKHEIKNLYVLFKYAAQALFSKRVMRGRWLKLPPWLARPSSEAVCLNAWVLNSFNVPTFCDNTIHLIHVFFSPSLSLPLDLVSNYVESFLKEI